MLRVIACKYTLSHSYVYNVATVLVLTLKTAEEGSAQLGWVKAGQNRSGTHPTKFYMLYFVGIQFRFISLNYLRNFRNSMTGNVAIFEKTGLNIKVYANSK